jgi:glycine betaine/choline ABC-type transport system substrate-binding protein
MNNAALYEAAKTGQVDIYVDYTSSIYYQLPDPQPIDRWMDLTGSITATMNGA